MNDIPIELDKRPEGQPIRFINRNHKCEVCGTNEDIANVPDPFSHEIYGDDALKWLCRSCFNQSAADI